MERERVFDLNVCLFLALFVFRYLRVFVGILTYCFYKPKEVKTNPKYTGKNVTVVVPTTFKNPDELVRCLERIVTCYPAKIIVVTALANVDLLKACCEENGFSSVVVSGVPKLNKRVQMCHALQEVDTDIVVFADDDVFWPERFLAHLLAIFEDDKVGAGGPRQRTRRDANPDIWNFLGIGYLERRVFNNFLTNAIDGSISTLSGRTAAYRTALLKTPEFEEHFLHDKWFGRPLNTDDDKCLTRYVYKNGYKIVIQSDPRAIIETTMESGSKYFSQCLRWGRAHFRGNFTVMTNETYWRSPRYFWGTYVIYISQFVTPALLVDGYLFHALARAMDSFPDSRTSAYFAFGCWVVFTKLVKLIPHFVRHPTDMKYIPASIAFSYFHGFLNIYALLTLTYTGWGSQNIEKLSEKRKEDSTGPSNRSGRLLSGPITRSQTQLSRKPVPA